MKVLTILTLLSSPVFGASLLKRTNRNMEKVQFESNFHSALNHLMRKTLMQDVSTYFDVILSGAETLAEVNAVLAQRNPHFVQLNQQELDILIDHWLFQMLAK